MKDEKTMKDVSKKSQSRKSNPQSTSHPLSNEPETRRRSSRIQNMIQAETMKMAASESSSDDEIVEAQDEEIIELDSSEPSSDDQDKKRKKKSKIAPIFLSKKARQLLEVKPEPKRLSQAVLDFLHSGVPDQISKSQKLIVARQNEEMSQNEFQLFPIYSHNIQITDCSLIFNSPFQLLTPIPYSRLDPTNTFKSSSLPKYNNSEFCCGKEIKLSEEFLSIMRTTGETSSSSSSETENVPWIAKYRVKYRKELVLDKEAFEKFEKWLRQWRADIKDGTNRKIVEKKKKKNESDSDFITDEEEEEQYLKKSVLLSGPTGCGKTAMVYVLARQIGFKVKYIFCIYP